MGKSTRQKGSGKRKESLSIEPELKEAAEKRAADLDIRKSNGEPNFSGYVCHLLRKDLGWPKYGVPPNFDQDLATQLLGEAMDKDHRRHK